MHVRSSVVWALACVCLAALPSYADPAGAPLRTLSTCAADPPRDPWAVEFAPAAAETPARPLAGAAAEPEPAQARRPVAFEYSEGYKTRAKIHRYSSFATLPLFIANYVVGQDLYNNHDESKKNLHVGLVTGTAVLFGVNSVTGVWNLLEARKDPNHRAVRTTHGILMLVADAGFLATAMLAPEDHEHEMGAPTASSNSASTHRAVAVTSMGIATVSYLIMLIGGR